MSLDEQPVIGSDEPPVIGSSGAVAVDRGRLPMAVAVIGLLSIAMLLGTDRFRQRSILRDNAHLKAVQEIQRDVAISHLWLEEHVSGDEVAVGEISGRLDRSLRLVGVMLGSEPADPKGATEALRDPELAKLTAELERQIREFKRLSDLRIKGFESALAVGIGSALDIEYDAVFAQVLAQAQALEGRLEGRRVRNRERSGLLFAAILLSWGALIAVAAIGLWSRERHRRRAEAALLESEAQLRQAQKLEAVGRVAGGLAHDINNYLAAIRGHCELVRRKRSAEDRIGHKMDAVIGTVDKATSLIDRLLAFSQKQPVELERVALNQVVLSLEKMLRPSLGADVEVEMVLADDLWSVTADLSQIEQVVVNLMINARDAMPEGGRIVLETSNLALPTGGQPTETAARLGRQQVMLAVRDSGCGIAPEAIDKIFDPFWTTKDKASHSGLGLATVYGIVRQSGGRIQVTSEAGEGTTFRIFLPRSAPVS